MPRDPSNPNGLRFETAEGVDHVVFTVPILSEQVLSSLASTLRSIAARADPRPLVLRSNHPTVFLAGADLREIAVLDSASCVDYADLGRSVVTALESHPAPTVAATAGSCSGGGFDIALACDAIVAGPRASFDHPGVRRGLVTGWTGTVSAPEAIGPTAARVILLESRRLDSEAALSLGLVGRICADPVRGAVVKALELARLDPSRLRSWRFLRGSRFVDRFRAFVVHKL